MFTFGKTGFGAGGSNRFIDYFLVTFCRNFLLSHENFVADGAVLALGKTGFGTGRINSVVNNNALMRLGYDIVIENISAVFTGVNCIAVCGAGRFYDNNVEFVSCCGNSALFKDFVTNSAFLVFGSAVQAVGSFVNNPFRRSVVDFGDKVVTVAVVTGNTIIFRVSLCCTGGGDSIAFQTNVNVVIAFFQKNLSRIDCNDESLNIVACSVLFPIELIFVCKLIAFFGKALQVFFRYRNPAGDVVRIGIVFGVLVCPERFVRAAVACVLDIFQISCGKTCGSVDFYADPPAVLISADGRIRRVPVKGDRAFVCDLDGSFVAVIDSKTGVGDNFSGAVEVFIIKYGFAVLVEYDLGRIDRNSEGLNITVGAVLLPVEFVYIVHALAGGDELLEIVNRYRNPAGDVVRIGIVFGVLVCPERFVRAAVACVLDIFQISCGKTCGSVDFYADPPAVLISADGRIRRIPVKGDGTFVCDLDGSFVAVVYSKTGVGDNFSGTVEVFVIKYGFAVLVEYDLCRID